MPKPKISDGLIAKFWELHADLGSYEKAWHALQDWSEAEGAKRGLRNPGQGWNSASGIAFEEICVKIIKDRVAESSISHLVKVARWKDTPQEIRLGILSELVWLKGPTPKAETAESNVDVVAVLRDDSQITRVVSVYSCKSSVAERYQQDLFWAEKLKARGIRFCFATIDANFVNHATGRHPADDPTKAVILAQALYDRVYLVTGDAIVQNPLVFKPIEDVSSDLDMWLKAY